MAFMQYKNNTPSNIQTSRKNQGASSIISQSTELNAQEQPSHKKTFRRFAHSQERNVEVNAFCSSDPKDKLISQFTKDTKVFFGHNDDPRKAQQLSNYIKSQPKTIIHSKGSIELKGRVEDYYSCNVNNIQSNLNQSCYKSKWTTSKEDYANMLRAQVERKEMEKLIEKREDKLYMKSQVEKDKEHIVTEREEKLKYLERIKDQFNEDNNKLQSINRIKVTRHRNQEILDHQEQLRNLAKTEARLTTEEEYKQFHEKEYFKTHLLKQIGAKVIEKKRKRFAGGSA